MNKKGFTLIELIVTIALLAVIAVISFVSISKALEQGRKNDCISLVGNIENAVNEYVSDNRYNSSFINTVADHKITIGGTTLVNGKYIGPIINPYTNKEDITESISILVTLKDNYTVKSVEITNPAVLKECK